MAKSGRSTVYNKITSKETLDKINRENKGLEQDFLDYLISVDTSPATIQQYKANIHVFWCWNYEYNEDKDFTKLTKREISRFQNHAMNTWGWSPKRLRTVKATMRSMENYILNILDEEYPDYKRIWDKIANPENETVRTKSIYSYNDIVSAIDKLVEMKKYEQACLFALVAFSGRRKQELARFKVSYFDDSNLICCGALYKTPEEVKTKGRGKRGKMLYLYVLAKDFKKYFDLWMKQREELGIESEWLFPDKDNPKEHIGVPTIDSWSRSFDKIFNGNWYMHSARHFFTTYLLDQNLPEAVVQAVIGWSSGDMVRLYDDRTVDAQLDKYFGADGIKQVEAKSLADL